ncbi:hypothetical protein CFK37_09480 [Virgibacillus phasianinus]|uniref:Amidohydrolase 3 domain-containing protein n=2 Tax=Virgibacillus phasianinus TaxID=2017483 RepID=A0A220U8R5_9BACI|nr:amidohydrolase [Virgibacillus phasianinus]ASK64352.1 hypothetical protein CFK37_09480 [Virgibacillus phasianinus]
MVQADLVITNGGILTLDQDNNRAGSVAVKDGRITGIWQESEPPKNEVSITGQTQVIDLDGATLIPGFIDTHNHISAYARMKSFLNCSTPPNRNIADILSSVQKRCERTQKGEWINGFGYDDTMLEEARHITKEELDSVSPDHPIFISHISGHSAIANSLAFEKAGIDESVSDSQGGYFGRDDNGQLNGVIFESLAMERFTKKIPEPTKEDLLEQFDEAAQDYLAHGITMNTDSAVGMSGDAEKEIDVHMEASLRGINPMRSQLMIVHKLLQKNGLFGDYTAKQLDQELSDRSNGRVKLDSAKLFQDGSIQALTSALREPYYCDKQKSGQLFHDQKAFNEELADLHTRGFRIAIHGNGDRAIGSIIDGYAHALDAEPRADHRHRIEHVQTGTKQDIEKMGNLGVAGSFFINHVYYWGERHKRLFLGPDRASRISPLADAVEHNLLFTLHSDCPITPISPLFSVWAAVNRLTREGEVLGAEQRIDVVTALKSMTIYGAYLNFDEANAGSIEVGKRADFAVLEADPTKVDPKEIKDIKVQGTFVDGEMVYRKEGVVTE